MAVIPAPIFIGINSSRNPDAVPAKAGNHYLRNTGFPRIKYPVSSTGQAKASSVTARNDKLYKTYVVMYKTSIMSFRRRNPVPNEIFLDSHFHWNDKNVRKKLQNLKSKNLALHEENAI